MKITHKIQMDLVRPNIPQVDLVQGDRNTRVLKIIPLEDGKPWSIPPHTSAIIRYQKPNGQYGIYDTLASGETAIVIANNEICATIAPDVLSGAGTAQVSISLIYGIEELSTFSILLNIRPGLSNPEAIDTSGMSITGMLPAPDNAVAGQYLLVDKVDNNGNVIKVRSAELTQNTLGLSPYTFTLADNMVCPVPIREIVSAHESGRAIWCVYKYAKYLLTHISDEYLVFHSVANNLTEIISIDHNGNASYASIPMQADPSLAGYYGIHVGAEPPEDENIQVWVDTDEEPEAAANGKDGVSPVVSVSAIAGGHRITITDAEGKKTLDVMDGEQGPRGETGDKGDTGATGPAGADYIMTASDKAEIAAAVKGLFTFETWTFTLADGSTIEKEVALL